jgi:uncharacterized membrane protein YphA (DoxX/SURF4 family)
VIGQSAIQQRSVDIPYPEVMAPFVGVCEIVCGALLILVLLTRLAAIPMIINISVAIVSTDARSKASRRANS